MKIEFKDNVVEFPGRESAEEHKRADFVSEAPSHIKWSDPKPLPNGLLPVKLFEFDFIPTTLAPWVQDISERMQCPPDFVGVSAVTALGAVAGRKVAIRPQRYTDWFEVPNFWGAIIGRPGIMKSPAMKEALKPLQRLEIEADERSKESLKQHRREEKMRKLQQEAKLSNLKKALQKNPDSVLPSDWDAIEESGPEPPESQRYIVNDCTYEALGAVLADNQNGVLAFRDELVSLLKYLDNENNASARGFFLSAWNGTSGYTFDRIIRGRISIEAACLSLLGSTQPGRIAGYLSRAISGGEGDDGLVQRFGLLVWPDPVKEWENVDRTPNSEARKTAWETFKHVNDITTDSVGAIQDEFDPLPFLRFDHEAQEMFDAWRAQLEKRLRSDELHPALESHLAKYRKLVPALSLLNHLAGGRTPSIAVESLDRAIKFAVYLESHARRAYGAGTQNEVAIGNAVLERIWRGDLKDGFTARDITQSDWSMLTDTDQVKAGLNLLVDHRWLAQQPVSTHGRPKLVYYVNPAMFAG
jgi:hypothetical protein